MMKFYFEIPTTQIIIIFALQKPSKLIQYNKIVSKIGNRSRGWLEGSLLDLLLHQGVGEGATPFPGWLHFTLDPYLIMLSVKQGSIKYDFFE